MERGDIGENQDLMVDLGFRAKGLRTAALYKAPADFYLTQKAASSFTLTSTYCTEGNNCQCYGPRFAAQVYAYDIGYPIRPQYIMLFAKKSEAPTIH